MLRSLFPALCGVLVACCSASGGARTPQTAPIALPPAENAVAFPLRAFAFPGPAYGEVAEAGASGLTDAQAEACFAGEDITGETSMSLALVEVRRDVVRVWGRDVMALEDGIAPEDQRKRLMLLPLYDALQAAADDMKAWASRGCAPWALAGEDSSFAGRVLLAVEPDVPMDTVNAAVYTAGQAQFGQVAFWVDDPEPAEAALEWPTPVQGEAPWPTVSLDGDGIHVMGGESDVGIPCAGGACGNVSDHDWAGLARTLDALETADVDTAVMTGLPGTAPFDAWIRMADVARGLPRPPSLVLVALVEEPEVALGVDAATAAPRPVALDGTVAVLRATQPMITVTRSAALPALDDAMTGLIGGAYGEMLDGGGLGSRGTGISRGEPMGLGELTSRAGPRSESSPDPGGVVETAADGMTTVRWPGERTYVLTFGPPSISGDLSAEAVMAGVLEQRNALRYSYQKEVFSDASLSGDLVVAFRVDPDGSVPSAEITHTTLNDPDVETAVVSRFRRMAFAAPGGEGGVAVELSIHFATE